MYIFGILIIVLGTIPLLLLLFTFNQFKGWSLRRIFNLFWGLLFVWQINSAIVYFHELLPLKVIEDIYAITNISTYFSMPTVALIAFNLKSSTTWKIPAGHEFVNKSISIIFRKKVIISLFFISLCLYIFNVFNPNAVRLDYVKIINTDLVYLEVTESVFDKILLIFELFFASVIIFTAIIVIYRMTTSVFRTYMIAFFSGSIIILLTKLLTIVGGTGNLINVITINIFVCCLIAVNLFESRKKQEELNIILKREKKLDYLGGISTALIHEIRNPVSYIKNFTMFIENFENLSDNGKTYLNYIKESNLQLEEITKIFSNYIKTNEVDRETCDLNILLEKAIFLEKQTAIKLNVDVTFRKDFEQLLTFGNPTELTQVFCNVIRNCIQAIPNDSFHREVQIQSQISGSHIYIYIGDNGVGINESEWESIFQPFNTGKSDGMGIGLPYSKKILLEHRGDIEILNSSEEGTVFEITLLPSYSY